MDRTIRYVRTKDGVQIAYWTLGKGEPLVYMAGGPWNHIEVWEVPQCRAWYEQLAQNWMLVRYDVRGTGLSQRDVSGLSFDGYVADLEAVVDELGLSRFNIFAAGDAGPAAICFAVQNLERVSRLILWCAWARGSDFENSPRIQAWRGLIDQDWELMADTCAHLALGWDAGVIGRQASEAFKASITRETAQVALEATIATDVSALTPRLLVPTLVVYREAISWLPKEMAFKLASSISNSNVFITPGETTAPYLGDVESLIKIMAEFLGSDGPAPGYSKSVKAPRQKEPPSAAAISANQRTAAVVEIFPVYVENGHIYRYAPVRSESWQVNLEPATHPGEVATRELNRLDCAPTVVHSTSWRLEQEQLVLTYLAVLPGPLPATDLYRSVAVQRQALPAGTALAAPKAIKIEQVVSHALRHLAWLAQKDGPIGKAIEKNWRMALRDYQPEPFSAFDLSGSLSEEDGCLLCTRFSRPLSQFVDEAGG